MQREYEMNRYLEMTRHAQMRAECNQFHRDNPEVWTMFVRFSREKIALGYAHYGAKAVMERIRWETSTGASQPELKINDHYTAFYARRFNQADGREFFRTRVQKSHAAEAMRNDRNADQPYHWWDD